MHKLTAWGLKANKLTAWGWGRGGCSQGFGVFPAFFNGNQLKIFLGEKLNFSKKTWK